jgi:hypothetical protein
MYEIKNRIFLELAKTQKSAICNFLRALVKKTPDLGVDELCEKFIEDEKYYLELKSSRFEFLEDFIDDEKFISDSKSYIAECRKYYDYKKTQAPLIQAQKDFDKKKRKFLQEVKMSKELPSKKQLSYYKSLCKRYNIEKKELEDLSKLDLKNTIEEIINEHKTD